MEGRTAEVRGGGGVRAAGGTSLLIDAEREALQAKVGRRAALRGPTALLGEAARELLRVAAPPRVAAALLAQLHARLEAATRGEQLAQVVGLKRRKRRGGDKGVGSPSLRAGSGGAHEPPRQSGSRAGRVSTGAPAAASQPAHGGRSTQPAPLPPPPRAPPGPPPPMRARSPSARPSRAARRAPRAAAAAEGAARRCRSHALRMLLLLPPPRLTLPPPSPLLLKRPKRSSSSRRPAAAGVAAAVERLEMQKVTESPGVVPTSPVLSTPRPSSVSWKPCEDTCGEPRGEGKPSRGGARRTPHPWRSMSDRRRLLSSPRPYPGRTR